MTNYKKWTKEEENFLKENFLNFSDEELSHFLHRSPGAIKDHRCILNLHRPKRRNIKRSNKREKPNFEMINKMFEQKNYILETSEEKYDTMKLSDKLSYCCKKHVDKGTLTITISHFLNNKGCYYCGRERTENSKKRPEMKLIDEQMCKEKGFEYIETKSEKGKNYIYYICPKHRILGKQKVERNNLKKKKDDKCPYCLGKNLPHWYVKNEIENKYKNLEVISNYEGMNKDIECFCKPHNIYFKNKARYVLKDGCGCGMCRNERLTDTQRLSSKEIQKRVFDINNDLEVINSDNYKNYDSKIDIKCKKCGYIWKDNLYGLKNKSGHCPSCYQRSNTSTGELKIANFLKKSGINYIAQYTFEKCINKRMLPFDVAILNKKNDLLGLIEYQGMQHYQPVDYFGGIGKFNERKENDDIKRNFCKNNNIPLLEIPYWDFNDIDLIVGNFINDIK